MLIKAVFDTNVWISALRNPGNPRKIVNSFQEELVSIYCAEPLLSELIYVLHRPKFSKIDKAEIDRLIAFIRKRAVFIELKDILAISPDPKDDMFLACAAEARCDFLVTGNQKDLLDLGSYQQTKIVNPAQFLQILNEQK